MNDTLINNIRTILAEQQNGDLSLLSVLEAIQRRYHYLPRAALILVSERLNVPLSQVYSVATFYDAFSLEPQGRHKIQLCTGTACHVRGAMPALDRLETKLDIQAGQTSADLEYTLEVVNCLGACALGPVLVADGEYHRQVTASKIDRLLKKLERQKTRES